ncbi:zonular occludens toxin domain-containing protein [Vibrio cincinnatiensis]|uniref:zonular occludens toxin domain-containing protein n=1 Tax=Vibrio cincinnatiensis TaxID=675 RepID=UPI0013027009|nr:zonular occludens toxin domain-containing protein [Vibrio cincinnatiensis]
MLHGFSGSPGTGKSLNAIKFIIENNNFAARKVYYHGVRVLLLDFDVCNSFHGWLYGVYYPANQNNTALKNKLLKIDKEKRLADIDDFPYLAFEYKKHNPVIQWITWFKRVASDYRLRLFDEALSVLKISEDELTGDIIKSLGLSWIRFDDPTLIHELPSGSVIFVDEVQDIWPSRQSSKHPTEDVSFVATHRHKAQDLIYVSQDFRDVDQLIRRRIAHYTHYEFLGGDWLHRFHSNNLFDPSSKADLSRVGSEKIKRDSKYYGIYLSAIEHTQKVGLSASMRKSLRLGFFAILILLVGVISLFQTPLFKTIFTSSKDELKENEQVETQGYLYSDKNESSFVNKSNNDDLQNYISKYVPRYNSIPWSASIYDSVTEDSKTYPTLTCVKTSNKCACFTQQMTSYDISEDYCIIIANHGFFDPFLDSGSRENTNRSINQQNRVN